MTAKAIIHSGIIGVRIECEKGIKCKSNLEANYIGETGANYGGWKKIYNRVDDYKTWYWICPECNK